MRPVVVAVVVFALSFVNLGFVIGNVEAAPGCSPKFLGGGPPNLNFQDFSGGVPVGWYTEEFWGNPVKAEFPARWGEVGISSPGRTVDARWTREAEVCSHRYYTLEGYLWTENVFADRTAVSNAGASLRVMDCFPDNRCWEQTNGLLGSNGWTWVSMTFYTGPLTRVKFGPSLGTYAGMAGGKVWARDLRFYHR